MRLVYLSLVIINSFLIFFFSIGLLISIFSEGTTFLGYLFLLVIIGFFSVLEYFLIRIYKKNKDIYTQKKNSERLRLEKEAYEREKLIPGSKARINELGADLCILADHMAGLPINEGAETFLYRCEEKVIFERNDMTFELPLDKIRDITIKTDVEIQKSYVSSVGGAVGGYVLFGPLGAMVGGRAKEKKSKTIEEYLIFGYEKEDETVYISFEVTSQKNAQLFINLLDNKTQERKTVQL